MAKDPAEGIRTGAHNIRWLLTDVDGVLTTGALVYSDDGKVTKTFNAKDGLGLQLAQRAGIKVGLLSAKASPAVERRAADLGLDLSILGRHDKAVALDEFLEKTGLKAEHVAYIGDDLPDLPVLTRCGVPLCPADAVPEVRAVATVLEACGGRGVAREAVERLLRTRGQWSDVVDRYVRAANSTSSQASPDAKRSDV